MHTATKTSVLLIGAIGLAACDGPSEPFAFDPTFQTFADIDAAFTAYVESNVEEDGELLDGADVAGASDFDAIAGGTSTYEGAVIIDEVDDGGTLIGQLQLEVEVDTSRIDGRAGNFIHSEDGTILGTLLGTTTFVRDVGEDENHMEMDLTGALSGTEGEFDATLSLEGNFLNGLGDVSDIVGDADLNLGDGAPEYEEGAFATTR